jgi:hypothetical protein
MPRPSKKVTVGLIDVNGRPALDVQDLSDLLPGDEVEFISGSLDTTIAFAGAEIFGETEYRLPPAVNSKRLTVLASAPHGSQEAYEITDEGSGQTYRRQGEPAAHPVMIFGP